MTNLNYTWIAHYQNGTQLKQFNQDGSENLFKHIIEHELSCFEIENQKTGNKAKIDLKHGLLHLNAECVCLNQFQNGEKRLIYFRRNQYSTNGTSSLKHCVGMQTTINDINKKILVFVDNDTGQIELEIE